MLRILTDSSTGLTIDQAKKHNIEMVHMPISFENEEFLDGLNLSQEVFFEKLAKSKTLPRTSLVAQLHFEEIFEQVKQNGDEMIVLVISSKLSSTTQQAIMAKEAVGYDKIYVVDSLATVTTLIALVMEAVRMRDSGFNASQVAKEIENLVPKIKLFAYVDTLKYLYAGGRISGVAAVVGTMLNIKPSLAIEDGTLTSRQKFVGIKKAQASIVSQLKQLDFDNTKPVYFAHTNSLNECENIKKQVKDICDFIDGGTYNISATVATHTGPGACAIAFFVK